MQSSLVADSHAVLINNQLLTDITPALMQAKCHSFIGELAIKFSLEGKCTVHELKGRRFKDEIQIACFSAAREHAAIIMKISDFRIQELAHIDSVRSSP